MQEKTLKLSQIKPYPSNPRDITRAIAAVKESIKRFGYVVPIVVDRDHVIIAGHARYQALRELGEESAVVIVSDMSPERAKEWRVVDNRTATIATWDRDKLIAELRSLDGDMAPFFDGGELVDLMGAIASMDTVKVEQAVVDGEARRLKTQFETLAKVQDAHLVTVSCQFCGKSFSFDADIKGFGEDAQRDAEQRGKLKDSK